MYMEAIAVLTIIHMQGYLSPPTSTHIYIRNRKDTLKLTVSCPRTRCNAPVLETKTGLLNVESSAQPFSHHASSSDPYD